MGEVMSSQVASVEATLFELSRLYETRNFSYFDDGIEEGSGSRIDTFTNNLVSTFDISARQAGGIITSLQNLKYFYTDKGWLFLTGAGVLAVIATGLAKTYAK